MQSNAALISAAFLDRTLAFLIPLFLQAAGDDLQTARAAAREALQSYGARTHQELHLAAQIIGFGLRALDALARAADPDLDVTAVLRLNGSAASLNQAAMRCQKELDKLRAQPVPQEPAHTARPPAPLAEAPLGAAAPAEPPAPQPAPGLPGAGNAAVPILSRQQRRLAERLAKREGRRHPERVAQVEHALQGLRQREAAP